MKRVYVEKRRSRHESDAMDALAVTLSRIGYKVVRGASDRRDFDVVWNGRGHPGDTPRLVVECAWAPRLDYQLTHAGINGRHHRAGETYKSSHDDFEAYCKILERCLSGTIMRQNHNQTCAIVGEPFVLIPFQVPTDLNMDDVPENLNTPTKLMQWVSDLDLPVQCIFKRHPASDADDDVQLIREQDRVVDAQDGGISAFLNNPFCLGLISLNSNCIHDAMLRGVPAMVLGRGIWGDPESASCFVKQIPKTIYERCEVWDTIKSEVFAYTRWLDSIQYRLEDLNDDNKVRELIQPLEDSIRPISQEKVVVDKENLLVNLVAVDKGWLFEDLKAEFADQGCLVTEEPNADADRWIYMRPCELDSSPDLSRTVVQCHSMTFIEHGRADTLLSRVGGIVYMSPLQNKILEQYTDFSNQRLMYRPIGVHESWLHAEPLPPKDACFRVLWVGRIASAKNLPLFVDLVKWAKSQGVNDLEVTFLGEGLNKYAEALRSDGIEVEYYNKSDYSEWQQHYARARCLLITSKSEAGPLTVFESIASGTPVIMTNVGIAPLVHDSIGGYVCNSEDELKAAIFDLAETRDRWAKRAQAMRTLLNQWTIQGWVAANIEFASHLTGK